MVKTSTRTPKQDRAQKTRSALLDAAAAEFSEKGWEGTSAAKIAKRAGVATGSLYQYFNDKGELLRELGTSRQRALIENALTILIDQDDINDPIRQATVAFEKVIALVMAAHRDNPGLHEVLSERRVHDAELDALTTAGEKAMVNEIARLLAQWTDKPNGKALAFTLFGMVEGVIHAHVIGHAQVSDAALLETLQQSLLLMVFGEIDAAPKPNAEPTQMLAQPNTKAHTQHFNARRTKSTRRGRSFKTRRKP